MSVLNNFPKLNWADVETFTAVAYINYTASLTQSIFEPVFEENPILNLLGEGFYLIKSVNISATMPKDVFHSILPTQPNPIANPLPAFQIMSSAGKQLINISKIPLVDYYEQQLNYKFNAFQFNDTNLEILLDQNKFVQSVKSSEYGLQDFTICLTFEIEKTSSQKFIRNFVSVGSDEIKEGLICG